MTWKEYNFVSAVFPQTYSIHPQGKPMHQLKEITVHGINEYMKMIRGMQPDRKFKRVKVGNLGWEIKVKSRDD